MSRCLLPRDIESLCELYQSVSTSQKSGLKKLFIQLINNLWFSEDCITFRGKSLMDVIEENLEDIVFLNLKHCTLHFCSYLEKKKIDFFCEKSEMAIIFTR